MIRLLFSGGRGRAAPAAVRPPGGAAARQHSVHLRERPRLSCGRPGRAGEPEQVELLTQTPS